MQISVRLIHMPIKEVEKILDTLTDRQRERIIREMIETIRGVKS